MSASAAATASTTSTSTSSCREKHLAWSNKQGRILTANGKALQYYTKERGFPFEECELPHFHLGRNETRKVFSSWIPNLPSKAEEDSQSPQSQAPSLICGAWKRSIFCGAWEHSTEDDEITFNVQTNSLFVDLRIPRTRSLVLPPTFSSLASLTSDQLSLYARQHVFGGFSQLTPREPGVNTDCSRPRTVCTRHHCIDWNYVGTPRPRPNKWWIELQHSHDDDDATTMTTNHTNNNAWKEWAYATDDYGQHYYMERWERLPDDTTHDTMTRLALRKADGRDGILVVVGNHFNYLLDRQQQLLTGGGKGEENDGKANKPSSLVDLVDAAVKRGDRTTAETYLSIDAGHGLVSKSTSTNDWTIDTAIQPWKEGTSLFSSSITNSDHHNGICVVGDTLNDCHILWNKDRWDIYECSFHTVEQLASLFNSKK